MGVIFRKSPVKISGRTKVRINRRVTMPESKGNTISFLSSIRIFQLVFTSSILLPMLSNMKSLCDVKRDESFAFLVKYNKKPWGDKRFKPDTIFCGEI